MSPIKLTSAQVSALKYAAGNTTRKGMGSCAKSTAAVLERLGLIKIGKRDLRFWLDMGGVEFRITPAGRALVPAEPIVDECRERLIDLGTLLVGPSPYDRSIGWKPRI